MVEKNQIKNATKMKNENWENLSLSNGFIFSKVILNEEICKKIIQATTDLPPIDYIEYVENEKAIDIRIDAKGVRLDVYVKDGKGKVYNIEMQAVDTGELPERSRYYHSVIDLDLLEKGQNYIDIADSYVIFICMEDIFGQGLARYTFKNRCMELDDLILDDGTTKIFLNSKGTKGDISEDAKDFLNYLEGHRSDSDFIKQLENEVATVKASRKWRAEYMKQHVHDTLNFRKGKEEGINLGVAQGIEQGERKKTIEMAVKMLSDKMPLETISKYTGLSIDVIEDLSKDNTSN